MIEDELLSAGQAADALGISRQRLDELVAAGQISRRKVGRNYVYQRADLDAYRAKGKRGPGRPPKMSAGTQAPARPA